VRQGGIFRGHAGCNEITQPVAARRDKGNPPKAIYRRAQTSSRPTPSGERTKLAEYGLGGFCRKKSHGRRADRPRGRVRSALHARLPRAAAPWGPPGSFSRRPAAAGKKLNVRRDCGAVTASRRPRSSTGGPISFSSKPCRTFWSLRAPRPASGKLLDERGARVPLQAHATGGRVGAHASGIGHKAYCGAIVQPRHRCAGINCSTGPHEIGADDFRNSSNSLPCRLLMPERRECRINLLDGKSRGTAWPPANSCDVMGHLSWNIVRA